MKFTAENEENRYRLRFKSMFGSILILIYHTKIILDYCARNEIMVESQMGKYCGLISRAKINVDANLNNLSLIYIDDLNFLVHLYSTAYCDTKLLISNINEMINFAGYSHEIETFTLIRETIEGYICGARLLNIHLVLSPDINYILEETDRNMKEALPKLNKIQPIQTNSDDGWEELHPKSHWWLEYEK